MTCDECPCVPTAQADRRGSDEAILNLGAELFAMDDNNVFEYLKIDTFAGENRRYFWMGGGGQTYSKGPKMAGPPVTGASSPISHNTFFIDIGAFSNRIKFHSNLHLIITV